MPRVTKVKKARKAIPNSGIEVGDTYFWWKFKNGPKMASKEPPKPWQLTRSAFLQGVYQIQDDISNLTTTDLDSSWIEDITTRIREVGEQCQESLDNMPENLQYSPTAELLQERVDAMECWADELENIEIPDMVSLVDEIQDIEPEIS